jgi:hypothetical protein
MNNSNLNYFINQKAQRATIQQRYSDFDWYMSYKFTNEIKLTYNEIHKTYTYIQSLQGTEALRNLEVSLLYIEISSSYLGEPTGRVGGLQV